MSLASLLKASISTSTSSTAKQRVAMDFEMANTVRAAALAEERLDSVLDSNDSASSSTVGGNYRCFFYEAMLMTGGKREAPASFKSYQHAATSDDVSVAQVLKDIMLPHQRSSSSSSSTSLAEAQQSEPNGVAALVDKELQGFVYFFGAKTGSVFDNALTAVASSVAALVVAADTATSAAALVEQAAPCEGVENDDGREVEPLQDGHEDPSCSGSSGAVARFRQQLRLVFMLLYSIHNQYFIGTQSQCYAHGFEVLFRLMLQYHDPLLTLHLDQRQVDVGVYAYRWVRSLFAVSGDAQPWAIWDWLFAHHDRLLPTYVVLASLIERREEILRCVTADACHTFLSEFHVCAMFRGGGHPNSGRSSNRSGCATPPLPSSTTPAGTPTSRGPPHHQQHATNTIVPLFTVLPRCTTIKDLVKKARIAARNTPATAVSMLQQVLFPDAEFLQRDPQDVREHLLTFVALPVDADELVAVFASPQVEADAVATVVAAPPAVAVGAPQGAKAVGMAVGAEQTQQRSLQHHHHHLGYVVLDCRSQDSFNFARLPTALHVGDAIGFDAELLQQMRQRFESAKGSHLCVLGTGRALVEEINLLKLIVLHLTQHGFPYVSVASGGFKALIPFIKGGKVEFVRGGRLVKQQKPSASSSMSPEHSRTTSPALTGSGARSVGLGCVPQAPSEEPTEASARQSQRPPQGEGAPPPPQHQQSRLTGAELGQRAEELRHKAASWGWGVMQSLSETVSALKHNNNKDGAVTAANTSATLSSSAPPQPPAAPSAPSSQPPPVTASPQKQAAAATTDAAPTKPIAQDKARLFTTSSSSSRNAAQAHDDDDDDELDLITSVSHVTAAAAASGKGASSGRGTTSSAQLPDSGHDEAPSGAVAATPSRAKADAKPKSLMDDDDLDFLYTSASSPAPAKPSGQATTTTLAAAVGPKAPTRGSTTSAQRSSSSASTSQPHPFDDIFV